MQESQSAHQITDLENGYHLSPDRMTVIKDGEPGSLSKILETNEFVFFQDDDGRNAMFWIADDKGTIGGLSSNNSFVETGYLNSLESIITRTGERVIYMSNVVRPYLAEFAKDFEWEPPALDATKISFCDADAWGCRALFSSNTIQPDSVPKTLHVYEIGSDPALVGRPWVVSKRVYFNFVGTLILAQSLDLGEEGAIHIEPKDIRPRSTAPITLTDFAREVGARTKPPKDFER